VIRRGLVEFAAIHLVDADGRPVAEVASPLYAGVPTELASCPYADNRRGMPINRSALRQMTAVWPSLLASVRFLATEAGPPTVHDAWRVAVTGLTAPLVAGSPVPVPLAALFKACLGMSQLLSALLLSDDGVADAPFVELGTAAELLGELDTGRWLIGEVQACAGPPPTILAMLQAFGGEPGEATLDPAFAGLGSRGVWVDEATGAIGLHVAHLAAVQAALRRGEGDGIAPATRRALEGRAHPWLRAVTAIPDRPAAHARRLFPAGKTPAVVERYLADTSGSAGTLEARFEAELGG
jgi:hypothetical protein